MWLFQEIVNFQLLEKRSIYLGEKRIGENIFIVLLRAFFTHVFSRDSSEQLGTRAQSEIRSPPSQEHSASEKNTKEETESLHWPILLAVLWYSTRLFFLLPVLLKAMNTNCNRNHSAHHELKDSKPSPWARRLSEYAPLPEPAPLLTA